MKTLKNNIYFKLGTIVIITLLLLIPTSMIKNLIYERETTQNEAIREVSSKWGEEQTISGPFISIPYYRYINSTLTH
jgi:inner membrane protein